MNEFAFEDICIGMTEEFQVSVTEDMVEMFGDISGDRNPLHTDSAFAKQYGYSDRVVYGLLTTSFLSRLVGMYLPGINCLLLSIECKFKLPVYIGETLDIIGEVEECNTSMNVIRISACARKQNGDNALKAKLKVGFLGKSKGEIVK